MQAKLSEQRETLNDAYLWNLLTLTFSSEQLVWLIVVNHLESQMIVKQQKFKHLVSGMTHIVKDGTPKQQGFDAVAQ